MSGCKKIQVLICFMTEGSVTPELGVEQGQVPFLDKGFNFPL